MRRAQPEYYMRCISIWNHCRHFLVVQAAAEAAAAGKGTIEAELGLASTQALLQIARCLRRSADSQPPPAVALLDLQRKLKLMLAQAALGPSTS